jgi:exonuclease VII small subunit
MRIPTTLPLHVQALMREEDERNYQAALQEMREIVRRLD